MASSRWKVVELQKCRELGGERTGPTGRDTPDCDDRVQVGLEIKSYKKFVWLTEDWRQAKENAAKVGKPPVLAMKERGHGKRRDMVQMHVAHWLALEIGVGLADCPADGGDALLATTHLVDGDEVARMSWDDFVWLYKAYYGKD